MSKKILMVAYFTPPSGLVGAVRITKFIKYLLKLGWDITLVSVKETYYDSTTLNISWLEEIQGCRIIRTHIDTNKKSIIKDQGIYWKTPLKISLDNLLSKEIFDLALWNGGPFMHLPLTVYIMKKYNLPYILDLRDPWGLHPYRGTGLKSIIAKFFHSYYEKDVVNNASRVINVTQYATDMYIDNYNKNNRNKFITIPNGYDPDDFKDVITKKQTAFDIVYTGKFGEYRDPRLFFIAYRKFIKDNNLKPSDTSILWIGEPEEHIMKIAKESKIEKYLNSMGFMPYKNVLEFIAGAAVTLLITGNHPYEPTTKIFDYLALYKNILGIVKVEGFVSQVLNDVPNGIVAYQDKNEIYSALSTFFNSSKNNSFNRNELENNCKQFNRKISTNTLDKIFKEIVYEV